MNKDLLTFIDLCLIDGAISEKERKVIFAKAKELGVGKDECEVLIESLTQKKNKTTTKPTIKKREFEKKTIKSILPAPLNNENKLNSNIKSNNEKLLSLSKQEAEVIKKIKQRFVKKGLIKYSFSHFDLYSDIYFTRIKKNNFTKSKWLRVSLYTKSQLPTVMKKIVKQALVNSE